MLSTIVILFIVICFISPDSIGISNNNNVNFADAYTIEFKRASFSGTSLSSVYAKPPGYTTWYPVCYDTTITAADAGIICRSMGYNTSNPSTFQLSYLGGYSTTVMVRSVDCSSSTPNVTSMNDCTYSTLSKCTSGRLLQIKCGPASKYVGANRGVYIGGSQYQDEFYLRQLPNNQIQIRQIYTESWSNIQMKMQTTSSAEIYYPRLSTAQAICMWLGVTSAATASQTASIFVQPQNPLVADYLLWSFYCPPGLAATGTGALAYCQYVSGRITGAIYNSNSENAAAVFCGDGTETNPPAFASANPIWNYPMADPDTSAYSNVEMQRIRVAAAGVVVDIGGTRYNPDTGSYYRTYTPSAICSSTDTTAAFYAKVCEWSGYGKGATYNVSSQNTDRSIEPYWNYVNCPTDARSIWDCYTAGMFQPCSFGLLKLVCYDAGNPDPSAPTTQTPSPTGGSAMADSPATGPDFNPASAIVPAVFVIIVIGTAKYFQQKKRAQQAMVGFSSTPSSSSSSLSAPININNLPESSSSPYENFGQSSEMTAMNYNNMNPSPYFTPMSGSAPNPFSMQPQPPPPPMAGSPFGNPMTINNNANFGMYAPPPPPEMYQYALPGFGFGNYLPPPPPPQ